MAAKGIKGPLPSKAPTPGARPSFVLGSRPPSLRQAPPGGAARIKPMTGQTQYGKTPPVPTINGAGSSMPPTFGGPPGV
jgi:hypothetical protein